jgi:hypothetical protein
VSTAVPALQPLVRRFMPELDVLRGIAVLGVLVFHGFRAGYGEMPFTGMSKVMIQASQAGVFGVNLFFVLSGFLIPTHAVAALRATALARPASPADGAAAGLFPMPAKFRPLFGFPQPASAQLGQVALRLAPAVLEMR